MIDNIYGILDYCYGGVPVFRGYVSYKTLIKYSPPHPAYQRKADDQHVKEIEEFVAKDSLKFMPEVILSYNYSGIHISMSTISATHGYTTKFICPMPVRSHPKSGKRLSGIR